MTSLSSPPRNGPLEELSTQQAGVLTTRQLAALGVTRSFLRAQLKARRWRRVLPEVYVVFSGPMPSLTRVWVAVLYAGSGAVASHQTAAWLGGLAAEPPSIIDISVDHGGRCSPPQAGIRIRQSRQLAAKRHPSRLPPQTRLEDTVLDLVDQSDTAVAVIDLLLRACQRRLTTPGRLRDRATSRARLRWRGLVSDVLADLRDGVQSALERHYFRDVELAHGLPRGQRNARDGGPGRARYRDVRYRLWKLIVELDGRAAHPADERERDDLRDNAVLEDEGVKTLRYGWRTVVGDPCRTAAQVARLLEQAGWMGPLRRCGPNCSAADR